MANSLITSYLSDPSIPKEKRQQIAEGLNSGDLDEGTAVKGITAKYGNKYGSPEPAAPAANIAGEVAKKTFGAFNPANLASNVGSLGQKLAEKAPQISKGLANLGQQIGEVTPEMQAENEKRAADKQAAIDARAKDVEYLNSKGIVPDSNMSDKDAKSMAGNVSVATMDILKRPGEELTKNVAEGVKSGVLTGAEGVQKVGAAVSGNTDSLEGFRSFYGLKSKEQAAADMKELTPAERAQTAGEGLQNFVSGTLESAFSPASATIKAVPGGEQAMEAVNDHVMKPIITTGSGKIKEALKASGVQLSPEQEASIDEGVGNLLNLMLLKTGEDAGKVKANEALKTELASKIPEMIKNGDVAGAQKLMSQYEAAIKTPTTITGRTAAAASEGAGLVAKEAGKALKSSAEFFGEKVGLKDFMEKDAATLRAEAMNKGLGRQNTRLKTVNKAFEENTKRYQLEDGTQKTVTPIDTLSKIDAYPEIQDGTIKMGDYRNGEGALGKIRQGVQTLDDQIDSQLKNTGKRYSVDTLKEEAIAKIKADPELKASGSVSSTVKKLETRFDDYKNSYGDTIDVAELNNIRKVANKDWSPDTQDVSRVVGNVARDHVYSAVDDMSVRELLRQQGELLSAKNYAEKLNGTKVVGGRIGNYATRTAGALIGSTVKSAPIIGPVVGMLGGEYLARALQQAEFKSPMAGVKGLMEKFSGKVPKAHAAEIESAIQSNKTAPSQSAKTMPKSVNNMQKVKSDQSISKSPTNVKSLVEPEEMSPIGRIKTKAVDKVYARIPEGTVDSSGYIMKKKGKLFPTKKATPKILKSSGIDLNTDGSIKEGLMYNRITFTEDVVLK